VDLFFRSQRSCAESILQKLPSESQDILLSLIFDNNGEILDSAKKADIKFSEIQRMKAADNLESNEDEKKEYEVYDESIKPTAEQKRKHNEMIKQMYSLKEHYLYTLPQLLVENKGSWIGFYYKASNKIAHFIEKTEEAVDEKIRKLRPLPVSYVAKIEKNWKPKPEQVYPIEINGAWLDTEMRSVEILLK